MANYKLVPYYEFWSFRSLDHWFPGVELSLYGTFVPGVNRVRNESSNKSVGLCNRIRRKCMEYRVTTLQTM